MSDQILSCEECGASIYPEHLGTHKAGYWGGKLYCVHCFASHRQAQVTIDPGEFGTTAPSPAAVPSPAPPDPLPSTREGAISIQHLQTPTNMSFGSAAAPATDPEGYRRPLRDDANATRCRIFHAKLNDGALKYMQDHINEWIDGHPDVSIKHMGTQVGVVEGKHQEPHLIVTVFY